MDNWTKAEAIAEVALTADNPDALTARIAGLLDQTDVLRLALALACGEYHPERCDGYIARAQDELRHGRRPEWLDTEAHNG